MNLGYLATTDQANAEVTRALEAFAEILAQAPVPLDAHAASVRISNEVSRETGAMLTAPPGAAGP